MHSVVGVALLWVGCDCYKERVRGVPPDKQQIYHQSVFRCDGGTIPSSQINDDYCDCKDGSDEPGTSACAGRGSRFQCSRGGAGAAIATSRVNDGVCDCCDGSDEFSSAVICEDVCDVALAAIMKAFKEGHMRHLHYKEKGLAQLQHQEQRRQELRSRKSALEQQLVQLRKQVREAEAVEEHARDEARKESDARLHQLLGTQDLPADRLKGLLLQLARQDGARGATRLLHVLEQAGGMNPEMRRTLVEQILFDPTATKSTQEASQEAAPTPSALATAQAQLEASTTDLDKLVQELEPWEKQEEKGAKDGGMLKSLEATPAFLALQGRCFTLQKGVFTYEVCPFGPSSQKTPTEKFSLGHASGWPEGQAGFSMLFTKGDPCPGDKPRSLKVNFSCGGAERIVEVHEPQMCEYESEFSTPAACDKAHADLLGDDVSEWFQRQFGQHQASPPPDMKVEL